MLTRLILLLAALLWSTCFPAMADEPALDATVSALNADPWGYHGKRVRLTGTLGECYGFNCALCDGEQQPRPGAACASVSFPARGASRQELDLAHALERHLRYSTATIEASYDATCSGVKRPGSPPNMITVCTDKGSTLEGVTLVRVLAFRNGMSQIPRGGSNALTKPTSKDERGLRAALTDILPGGDTYGFEHPFLFVVEEHPQVPPEPPVEARGGACICLTAACAIWPVTHGQTYITTDKDPYRCWQAERREGRWRFVLSDPLR